LLIRAEKMTKAEAFRHMQKMSRDKCQTMKQTATEIINADSILG
jgi:AmiR/NasT family two-component response regulator